jgi:signal transduction histidine kinase
MMRSSPLVDGLRESALQSRKKRGLMAKIYLLAGAAIVMFMAFTIYSVHKEMQGRAQLSAIKIRYFPLLQKLDANIVRLDKIQGFYIQVVITGDRDTIIEAAKLGTQSDEAFRDIALLYPRHKPQIDQLRSELAHYQKLATDASIAFLKQDRAAAAPMAASMNRSLADLEKRLKSLRDQGYDDFVQTLATSQLDAEFRLLLGLAMGVMDLGFVAVLVYFIGKNMKMMAVIAVQNEVLERDIENLKQMEAALLQSRSLLQAVITDAPVAIQACDIGGRIILENRAARELFAIVPPAAAGPEGGPAGGEISRDGETPILGENRPLERALRGEIVTNVEILIGSPGGVLRTVIASARRLVGSTGECLGATVIAQDVTERKALERDLAQAHKLESIGQLAAGIAHEINTPTQFIGDNVRFLRESFDQMFHLLFELATLSGDVSDTAAVATSIAAALQAADLQYLREEIPQAIVQALEGVERIANIVAAMKEFSHPGVERVPVDLNRAIASTITVARNEWRYVADLATAFDATLPFVPVMPGPFNQVVLNLIVNAAHAISEVNPEGAASKGKIVITTRRLEEWAEIEIQDTGSGIPADLLARIFDPFFTTKPLGKGTGQGLAIAHNVIVDKHGGSISVDSKPGLGTRFTLRLPMSPGPVDSAQAA